MSMLNKYNKYTCGQIEAILNTIGGEEVMDKLLAGTIRLVKETISYIVATFKVTVDETVSVEETVKIGKFDWSSNKITSEKFSKLADGEKSDREVVIFHFNKIISSQEVIAEMDRVGFRPANIWQHISLAVKHPNLQRKFSIVALGSICFVDGSRAVPVTFGRNGGRYLDLIRFDRDCWNVDYRFTGVRK